MKTPQLPGRHQRGPRPVRRLGFTLTEMMVGTALFSVVVLGVLSMHLFGLRMFSITATKLGASQGSRSALDHVRDEIRSGKILVVGNGGRSAFTNIAWGQPRLGNCLQIYATSDTNSYIRYYLDTSDQALKRVTSTNGQPEIIAKYLTNRVVFAAEDCLGHCLTNDQNNRVIRMTLEFYQWEFPVASVGAYYDYYRLQTRTTRRSIE